MTRAEQEGLFREMARPGFYPDGVQDVHKVETHISMVFLTGETVYKVKKAVDLGFLDFSTLENRRRCCELEVSLNRRLSRDVYLGVAPIFRAKRGGHSLTGETPPVEYAVCMRQLPEAKSLSALLAAGAVETGHIEALAERLCRFYADQGPSAPQWSQTARERLEEACLENFVQTEGAAPRVLSPNLLQGVRKATEAFIGSYRPLFDDRARRGCIRDGHGDLRTEHVYFLGEADVHVIDCIEFSAPLRHIDTASDMAFLAMDLDERGTPDWDAALIAAYVRTTGDTRAYALLPFYKCYRAMVRCKVAVIRLAAGKGDPSEGTRSARQAARYLKLAHYYAVGFSRPVLWVVSGIPGSGKSTLARGVSEALGIEVIRSDVIRKALFGLDPLASAQAPPAESIYTPAASRLTYGKLLRMAEQRLTEGGSVILDATFSRRKDRDEIRRTAQDLRVPLRFVQCSAPDEVILQRLGRRKEGASVSDARPHHFAYFKSRFEAFAPDESDGLSVDTAQEADACLRQVLQWDYRTALAGLKDM